jgi:hypothetical protein
VATIKRLVEDHVLRRNIRIVTSNKLEGSSYDFIRSGLGTHHLMQLDYFNSMWNEYTDKNGLPGPRLPRFPDVPSGETFGLVESEHIQSGLDVKQEAIQEYTFDEDDISNDLHINEMQLQIAEELNLPMSVFDTVPHLSREYLFLFAFQML